MDTVIDPSEPLVAALIPFFDSLPPLTPSPDAASLLVLWLRRQGWNITENSPELVESEWGDTPVCGNPMVGLE